MKLNLVPARTGMQWVREGVRVFWRMPLAFASLFLMTVIAVVLLSMIPLAGGALALVLAPAATVGLMAATQHALQGQLPLPVMLLTAFRQTPRQTRDMLLLGAIYAAALLAIAAIAAAASPGADQLPRLLEKYHHQIGPELLADPERRPASRAFVRHMLTLHLLYLPVAVLLWHAPALVHWHGLPVGKSLFFSAIAVLRNAPAYLVYGLGWMAVTSVVWAGLMTLAALAGNLNLLISGIPPVGVLIFSMFYASLWFTFRDSFVTDAPPPAPPEDAAG
jgi:hypothetical protein